MREYLIDLDKTPLTKEEIIREYSKVHGIIPARSHGCITSIFNTKYYGEPVKIENGDLLYFTQKEKQ